MTTPDAAVLPDPPAPLPPLLDWPPLPGSVCEQFVRCDKAGCRCRIGRRHGPYFYRVWRLDNQVQKVYVKKADVERVRGQCEAYRLRADVLRPLRAELVRLTARLRAERLRSQRLRARPWEPKRARWP